MTLIVTFKQCDPETQTSYGGVDKWEFKKFLQIFNAKVIILGSLESQNDWVCLNLRSEIARKPDCHGIWENDIRGWKDIYYRYIDPNSDNNRSYLR